MSEAREPRLRGRSALGTCHLAGGDRTPLEGSWLMTTLTRDGAICTGFPSSRGCVTRSTWPSRSDLGLGLVVRIACEQSRTQRGP